MPLRLKAVMTQGDVSGFFLKWEILSPIALHAGGERQSLPVLEPFAIE